jgi:RNA polymerase sigma-70 factor (ECF subfamily)
VSERNQQAVSFEELAMPLLEALYNFACYLARDRSEADDLVQETYLKGLKGFSSFQPGTNFRAWMFRILRNTFLTSKSGLAASRTISLDDDEQDTGPVAVTGETPETLLLQSASDEMVRAAIADLPVIYREALLLCDVEEMSYQEIAEALSIPTGTVMSRISRARKAVRDRLQEKTLEAKHG